MIQRKILSILVFILFIILFCSNYYLMMVNNSLKESQMNSVDKFSEFQKQLLDISKDLKFLDDKQNKYKAISEKMESQLSYSTVQIPTPNETLKLQNNFDNDEIISLNLSKEAKFMQSGAYQVNFQLVWCSQYDSGYLAMGTALPKINVNNSNGGNWTSQDEYTSNQSNEWTLMIKENGNNCSVYERKVRINNEGIIFITSEGYSSNNNSEQNTRNSKLRLIIKGQQVSYNQMTQKDKSVIIYPQNVKFQINRGKLQLSKKKFEDALKWYQKALEVDMLDKEAIIQIGLTYLDMGNQKESKIWFDEQIDVDRNKDESNQLVGRYIYDFGNQDECIKQFQKSLEFNPTYLNAIENLGYAQYEQKNQDEAIIWLKKSIEIDSTLVNPHIYIGFSNQHKNNKEKAIEWQKKAIEMEPNQVEIFQDIGIVQFELKEKEEAIKWQKKALKIDPEQISAQEGLGEVQISQKDYDIAIECYQKILEFDPKFKFSYLNIGDAQRMKKEQNKAIINFKQALEIDPNFNFALVSMGQTFQDIGQYEESIKWQEKCIDVDPKFSPAYEQMGLSQFKLKQQNNAMKWLKKAIEIDPSRSEEIYEHINIAQKEKNCTHYESDKYCKKEIIIEKQIQDHNSK